MVDHSRMKLGKRHPRFDARVPLLGRYLRAFPPPPDAASWTGKLNPNIGMMGNDQLGDCVFAAIGHSIQVMTSQAKAAEVTVPDADIIAMYSKVAGYVPGNPATDQGAVIADALTNWLSNPLTGNALAAFASLEPGNSAEIKDAVWLFGGVDIGLALPISAQSQDIWQVPPGGPTGPGEPGSWGGHSVFAAGYDSRGVTVITWGALKTMTWEFWNAYCDEAYALLSPDWENPSSEAPSGVSWDNLVADMAALKTGQGPPRNLSLTDDQLWLLSDAVQSKLDGISEDQGVVVPDLAAQTKRWQDMLDYLGMPRIKPH